MASRLFTPGNEPGAIASGFGTNVGIMKRTAAMLGMGEIPVGGSVASLFPWLRYVRQPVPAGQQVIVQRRQWDSTFTNQTTKPIKITELRLYIGNQINVREFVDGPGNADVHPCGSVPVLAAGAEAEALQKYIWVKLSIPDRRDMLQEWMPMFTLMTEGDHLYPGELDRFAIPFPAPYFLNRSHPFTVDIGRNEALVSPQPEQAAAEDLTPFYLMLHGYGVLDGEPLDLVKAVPNLLLANVDYGYETLSFDDDRDLPMRDAIITHFSLGAGSVHSGLPWSGANRWMLQHVQIRPHAPEGPTWHSGEFFPIAVLAKHVSGVIILGQQVAGILPASVRHIPITPYTLYPGEKFVVELWNRTDKCITMGYAPDTVRQDMNVDVALIGTQEA